MATYIFLMHHCPPNVCLQVSFSIPLGTLGTVSFTRIPTEMPMAMAQHCLDIKAQRPHQFLEGEDQLPAPSSEGGGVPSSQMSAIHTWLISEYTETGSFPYAQRMSDVSLFLSNQCRKVETNITWTMPAGVTSSWQQAPVPTCLWKALYARDIQSWQPHKAGTLFSPFDDGGNWVSGLLSFLAKVSGAAWSPNQSSLPTQKSMERNQKRTQIFTVVIWWEQISGFGSTYSRWTAVPQTFPELLGCTFPGGAGRWTCEGRSMDL